MVLKLYDYRDNMYIYLDKVTSVKHGKDAEFFLDYPKDGEMGYIAYKNEYVNVYNGNEPIIINDWLFDLDSIKTLPFPVGVVFATLEDDSEKRFLHNNNRIGFLMSDEGKTIERL